MLIEKPGPQACNAGITPGYMPTPATEARIADLEAAVASLTRGLTMLALKMQVDALQEQVRKLEAERRPRPQLRPDYIGGGS